MNGTALAVAAFFGAAAVVLIRRAGTRGSGSGPPPPAPPDRIEMVDPRELLFILPTLHHGVPPTKPGAPPRGGDPRPVVINEDDWRQAEFVAAANAEYVGRVLREIARHRAVHAVEVGFREVYVREEPPVPLGTTGLTADGVAAVLGAPGPVPLPLYLESGGEPARVVGGFAFAVPGVGAVYGHEVAGRVAALGLSVARGSQTTADPAPLARLSERFSLLFVDWVRLAAIPAADGAALRAYVEAETGTDPD